MKRRILFAGAALTLALAAVVGLKAYRQATMPALLSANLEALTQGEVVKIPCVQMKDSQCTVEVEDLLGNKGWAVFENSIKATGPVL